PVEILAINLPDSVKGEIIVLLLEGDLDPEDVRRAINASPIPPLMKPKEILKVDEIPKLGTGKSDFNKAKKIAAELRGG
ncbi:2-acyl-glycerophospho-ethanolamine acyltransferase, partial [Fibrobacterota bacterium]